MLADEGIDFDAAYPAEDRHGVFFRRETYETELDADTLARIPEDKRPTGPVTRSRVAAIDAPFFGDIADRVGFVFGEQTPDGFQDEIGTHASKEVHMENGGSGK